jgi:two-component system sensor histidine kinase YesM
MSNRLRLKLLATCQSFIESFSGSIKKKMFIVLVLLTCIPLIVLTVVAIHNARNQLEAEITGSNISKIQWSGRFLDDQMQLLDQILFSMMNDQVVSRFMETAQKPDEPVDFNAQTNLFEKLSAQYLSNSDSFDEIMLYKKDLEKVYSVTNGQERILQEQGATAPWNALGGRKTDYVFGAANHFTMYRSIYRFIDRQLMGGVAILVNWSVFSPIFESLESDSNSTIAVMDEAGHMVYEPLGNGTVTPSMASGLHRIMTRSANHFYKSDTYYYFYQPIANGKMTLIKMIPTSVVSESSKNTIWFSIWIVPILIIACVIVSIFIANKAASPILKLVRAIAWTEETNSDLSIGRNRKDEIGLLERKSFSRDIKFILRKDRRN